MRHHTVETCAAVGTLRDLPRGYETVRSYIRRRAPVVIEDLGEDLEGALLEDSFALEDLCDARGLKGGAA